MRNAGVAELVDAQGLGPCSLNKGVEVQVLSPAQRKIRLWRINAVETLKFIK